jgi:hypothetical protein
MTFWDFLNAHPDGAFWSLVAVCITIVATTEAFRGGR